ALGLVILDIRIGTRFYPTDVRHLSSLRLLFWIIEKRCDGGKISLGRFEVGDVARIRNSNDRRMTRHLTHAATYSEILPVKAPGQRKDRAPEPRQNAPHWRLST